MREAPARSEPAGLGRERQNVPCPFLTQAPRPLCKCPLGQPPDPTCLSQVPPGISSTGAQAILSYLWPCLSLLLLNSNEDEGVLIRLPKPRQG